MRIAWIVYGPLDQVTGGYLYDRLVVDRLRARGDHVRVISLPFAPASRLFEALALARRLVSLRPDVVVGDELCFRELAMTFPLLPRSIARVLLVHHLTHWELPRGLGRAAAAAVERAALRSSDARLATSATTAARLLRDHGIAAVDVAVPGADRLPLRPRRRVAGGPLRVLFVGTWIPRKRILALLAAFNRVGEPRATLSLIGDPGRDVDYAARVRRAIAESRYLRDHVETPGLLGDGALADALAEADALVLPSQYEGYGMVLTEALRAGVPVMASRAGAIPEVVRDGEEALLFDREADLAAALGRFFGDAALRGRMQAAAEARGPSLPAWDDTADAVRAALARAARARAG